LSLILVVSIPTNAGGIKALIEWLSPQDEECRQECLDALDSFMGKAKNLDYITPSQGKITQIQETREADKSYYWSSGEIKWTTGYVDGNKRTTYYYKSGEIQEVDEYVNGKFSKATIYHKNGKVKSVKKY
ncbi:MAG: hypothetical protein NZ735_03025, partial [Candidatus Marinimicrobia bacterium]|nr:hypothetical protein [Candidatus Neomarinimicrobiota bacterium]